MPVSPGGLRGFLRHTITLEEAKAIGLGGLFLPLVWLWSSWLVNAALYGAFVVGYGDLLLGLRVVTPREVASVWRSISPTVWSLKPTGLGG